MAYAPQKLQGSVEVAAAPNVVRLTVSWGAIGEHVTVSYTPEEARAIGRQLWRGAMSAELMAGQYAPAEPTAGTGADGATKGE